MNKTWIRACKPIGRLSFEHLSSKVYNVHVLKICTRWLSLQFYKYMQLDLQIKTAHALLQCKQRCVIALLVMWFYFLLCCSDNDSMLCINKHRILRKMYCPKTRHWRGYQHKWNTLIWPTKNIIQANDTSIAPNTLPIIIIEAYQLTSFYSKL